MYITIATVYKCKSCVANEIRRLPIVEIAFKPKARVDLYLVVTRGCLSPQKQIPQFIIVFFLPRRCLILVAVEQVGGLCDLFPLDSVSARLLRYVTALLSCRPANGSPSVFSASVTFGQNVARRHHAGQQRLLRLDATSSLDTSR